MLWSKILLISKQIFKVVPFAFHLPWLRIDLDWFAEILTNLPFGPVCVTWNRTFATFTPYHWSIESLLCSPIPAKDLLCHLTPIVILGSKALRLNGNDLLSGKDKHIFRGTKIELLFEIRWHLFILKFIRWVASSKIHKLFVILQWRRSCDRLDLWCRFIWSFINSDGYPFVSGCLGFIHFLWGMLITICGLHQQNYKNRTNNVKSLSIKNNFHNRVIEDGWS